MTTGRINQVTIICLVDWARSVLLWHTTSGTLPCPNVRPSRNYLPPERRRVFLRNVISECFNPLLHSQQPVKHRISICLLGFSLSIPWRSIHTCAVNRHSRSFTKAGRQCKVYWV